MPVWAGHCGRRGGGKRSVPSPAKWQTEDSSYWACCDQIVSGEGNASRYYPSIITSALWIG
jgi:hypothetical protein